MKLDKQTRSKFSKTIQVDSYELVAALRSLGFESPRRCHYWVSEEIAEDFYDDVVDNSVYVYPYSEVLAKTLDVIKSEGIKVGSKDWDYFMDELKDYFGVGPSTLKSYSARLLPSGRYEYTRHDK